MAGRLPKDVLHLLMVASGIIEAKATALVCPSAEVSAQSTHWNEVEKDITLMDTELLRLNLYFASLTGPEGSTRDNLTQGGVLQVPVDD